MFGISVGECLVILIIALFVLGPERLPIVARLLGKWWARAQRLWRTVREDIEGSMK